MEPLRRFFGRKSEDDKATENDSYESPQDNMTRLNRRHSSARSNSSTEGSQDPTTKQSKLSPRRSMLSIRPLFKSKSSTSSCQICHKSACQCTSGLNTEDKMSFESVQLRNNSPPGMITRPLLTPTDVCALADENANEAADKASDLSITKMNGGTNHIFRDALSDYSTRDQLQKLSAIEKKILSQKQNTMPGRSLGCGSVIIDTVNDQSVEVAGGGSPRLFTKRSSTAPFFSRFQHCSSSFSGLSKPSTGNSSQANGFCSQLSGHSSPPLYVSAASSDFPSTATSPQDTNLPGETGLENQHNPSIGFSEPTSDLSATSVDVQHANAAADPSVILENIDNSSTEAPRSATDVSVNQTACLPTSSSVPDWLVGDTDTPVPPPRRKGSRASSSGRWFYKGDLSRVNKGQQISTLTKSRSWSELYLPSSSGTELTEEEAQSRSSTVTSGIESDVFLPSVTASSSNSSSLLTSSQSTSATAATPNSENSEPGFSLINSALSSSSSSVSTTTITTVTITSGSNVDFVELKPLVENSSLSSPSLSTTTSASDTAETTTYSVNATMPSSSSLSEHAEHSYSSHGVSERFSAVIVDQAGREKPPYTPLSTRELLAHSVTLRALRYSSNCVDDCSGHNRFLERDSTSSTLARMTGLTLGHVMTPPLVTTATERPAAVSDHVSPSVSVSEAEISQLADDLAQTNNNQSLDHEIHDERSEFYYIIRLVGRLIDFKKSRTVQLIVLAYTISSE